jgi:GH25 family lysozyme M1 (1,4-beta-N-acetylmuramidase)
MKKLLWSLAASCLMIPIASPSKADVVRVSHQVVDHATGDFDGLGYNCIYYQVKDTYLDNNSGETSAISYWLNSGTCDWTSPEIKPTDFGI